MVTVIQTMLVLLLIVIIILFAFKPRRHHTFELPEGYQQILLDYVKFYVALNEDQRKHFEDRLQKFLTSVKITGVNAEAEDLDVMLIASAAIIPVFYIRDWEYINLREVLLYPGNFNTDFDQHGTERPVLGMVGTGPMQNVMILNKWDLRLGFINSNNRNTAIHEFVHLIDKMDGTLDGAPEILLERKYLSEWRSLLDMSIQHIKSGYSDLDPYAATNHTECFAVIGEYFFEQPDEFARHHPQLSLMMKRIFRVP